VPAIPAFLFLDADIETARRDASVAGNDLVAASIGLGLGERPGLEDRSVRERMRAALDDEIEEPLGDV
jgi:hypothetical protein